MGSPNALRRRGFASENHASVHPAVMATLAEANRDHAGAYGDDPCAFDTTEDDVDQLAQQLAALLERGA